MFLFPGVNYYNHETYMWKFGQDYGIAKYAYSTIGLAGAAILKNKEKYERIKVKLKHKRIKEEKEIGKKCKIKQ